MGSLRARDVPNHFVLKKYDFEGYLLHSAAKMPGMCEYFSIAPGAF